MIIYEKQCTYSGQYDAIKYYLFVKRYGCRIHTRLLMCICTVYEYISYPATHFSKVRNIVFPE